MNNPELKKLWVPAMSKELHRLAQGKEGITVGSNIIFFLSHDQIRCIPKDCTVTYARIVIDHCPQKDNPNHVRITVGGNLIDYSYELTTCTANMVSTKTMWNSVVSTPSAKFGGADIKNMYLETPLDRYKYMKMPMRLIPDDIIEHYSLREKALDGYAYMEIHKGMYGLPQAGILANKLLKERLARHGYFEQPHTPGLWKHLSPPSGSTYASTTSVSSTLARTTSNTFSLPFAKKPTALLKIGLATYIVASHLCGTRTSAMLTYQCQRMMPSSYSATNIHIR